MQVVYALHYTLLSPDEITLSDVSWSRGEREREFSLSLPSAPSVELPRPITMDLDDASHALASIVGLTRRRSKITNRSSGFDQIERARFRSDP